MPLRDILPKSAVHGLSVEAVEGALDLCGVKVFPDLGTCMGSEKIVSLACILTYSE